jgi:PAS domain S-box-containing protein
MRTSFDIPVVYLTGYADDATLQRAKVTEPYGYLLKPFESRELITTIETAVHKHAVERRLRESEKKYRTLVENSLQGIVIVQGMPPSVIFANPPCVAITGYALEELLSLSPEKAIGLIHPKDRARLLGFLTDCLAGQPVPSGGEFRLVRRGGAVRWVAYYGSLIKDRGQPAVQASLIDITERKQGEEVLQQARHELERRVEERTAELASANALLREQISTQLHMEKVRQRQDRELQMLHLIAQRLSSSLDLNHVVATVLNEARYLLDASGCTVWLIEPETGWLTCKQASGPHSEALTGFRVPPGEGLVGWAAKHEEDLLVTDARTDARHFKKVDVQIGVETRCILSVPLKVKQNLIGVLQVVDEKPACFDETDLTLLKPLATSAAIAIENARLYDEANRLRAFNENIVQSMQEGIFLEDDTGHITFANPAITDLLGYRMDDLRGQHWGYLVDPEYRDQVERERIQRLKGTSSRYETVLVTKEGQRLPVIISARPMFDDGHFGGTLAVFMDISDRKRAEESLRKRVEELSALNALGQQVSASLSPEQIIEAALKEIADRANPDLAMLYLRQGEELLLRSVYPDEPEHVHRPPTPIRVGQSLLGLAVREGQALYSRSIRSDPRCTLETWKEAGIRSFAALPLLKGEEVLGVLGLASAKERDLDQQAAFLEALASQTAMGLQNALLHQQLQRHAAELEQEVSQRKQAEKALQKSNRELALLNRVIAGSAVSQESSPILETVCRELALAFEAPQSIAALFNEDRTEATIVAEYSANGRTSVLGRTIAVAENSSVQHLVQHKAPLLVADAQTDPFLTHDPPAEGGAIGQLILPLVVEEELVGSIGVSSVKPGLFSAEEVELAQRVAEQVSGALARARLTEAQQRLSTAIEHAAEAVIITSADGTILYVNPAFEQTTGYSRSEATGQNPRILNSGRHDDAFYRAMWRDLTAGRMWQGRLINRKKDSTQFLADETIASVRNQAGEIVNYVATMRDVTREVELEEQSHHAQKMEALGRLAGGIAHEFGNLLHIVEMGAEVLKLQIPPKDPIREHVDQIQRTGQRAYNLTRQLLRFSRREALEPQVLDLNLVVADMSSMLQYLIGREVALVTVLGEGLSSIKVNPSQMEQVLMNLVINACHAMPNGGTLTIETSNVVLDEPYADRHMDVESGEFVLLTISDTGTGMTEEVRARLFEPFFTTKARGEGTGLGLSTVLSIVENRRGYIQVDSEVGRGTTFRIYFPSAKEGEADATSKAQDAVAS